MKDQKTLVLELAKRLEKEPRTRESALKTLQGAGIVDEFGNLKGPYKLLNRVITSKK